MPGGVQETVLPIRLSRIDKIIDGDNTDVVVEREASQFKACHLVVGTVGWNLRQGGYPRLVP